MGKALSAFPLCLVLYCFILRPGCRDFYTLTETFCDTIFGIMDYEDTRVYIMTVENIAFIMMFNLMLGGHIAHHFRYSCVYVFTRLSSRRGWYAARALEIIVTAVLYCLFYVGSVLLISLNASQKPLDVVTLNRVLLVFLFSFLFVSSTTLLANILSLRYGTAVGFFITEGVTLTLLALLTATYRIKAAVLLNPIAFLNLFDQ